MRIIFMGTPDFSVPVLDALVAAGHDIAAVYCQPPRPAGRGKKDRPTPVHARAAELGLLVHHPTTLKTPEAHADFTALNADIAVVVAYGLILPQTILDMPTRGCLNIHASLLPRWRGAAPIHRAIMAGDENTGICIMQMEAGLDTGPVLLRRDTSIGMGETTGELHDRLSQMGADLMVDALGQIDALVPIEQPIDGVTYAAKIDKSEARIDWSKPAVDIDRAIHGLSPFPGAWCMINDARVKILASCVAQENTAKKNAPGEAIDNAATIACGAGAIQILRLQRAGKGAQDIAEYLRGTPLNKGTMLP